MKTWLSLICFLIFAQGFAHAEGLRVHYKNSANWENPYVYHWDPATAKVPNPWPGQPMREEGNGWWSFEISGLKEAGLVFSDKGGAQTPDARASQVDTWFKYGEPWPFNPDRLKLFTFPRGLRKSVVLSFDDGNANDRRLIELLNRYNLRGTFHLNSGLALQGADNYIPAEDIRALYEGHEVTAHTLTHPDLTQVGADALKREVLDDRRNLEKLTGQEASGFSYPYGSYNQEVIDLLRQNGFLYARTIGQTHSFRLPNDLLQWHGSGYQSDARYLTHRYLNESHSSLTNLMIWGHSWDMGGSYESGNNWHACEEFLSSLGNHPEVWSATMSELATYIQAIGAANVVPVGPQQTRIDNNGLISLWVRTENGAAEIKPHASLILRQAL